MSRHLGQLAYAVWVAKRREMNIRTVPWNQLPYYTADAWEAVADAVARECGVDPAAFDLKQAERPNEGG